MRQEGHDSTQTFVLKKKAVRGMVGSREMGGGPGADPGSNVMAWMGRGAKECVSSEHSSKC